MGFGIIGNGAQVLQNDNCSYPRVLWVSKKAGMEVCGNFFLSPFHMRSQEGLQRGFPKKPLGNF